MKKGIIALLVMMGMMTYADIATFDIQAYLSDVKQKNNGSASLTVDSVFMLIADGNNDGLNMDSAWDQSLFVANNYLDNEIIYKGTAIDDGEGSYLWSFTTGDRGALSAANDLVVAGDNYYMVWFEGLQNDVNGTPSANSWVGSYREATAEWQLPSVNGLRFPAADPVNMNNVTWTQAVPEPASALLVALGGGMVYALRRRGHHSIS
jgi:hypothetical protein